MHALCQSLQRDGALANVDLIKLTAFAIFSNFTFENGFATISNFTFANGFDTISNFAFANGFNTIFILLSLVNLLLQNDAFLVRKVIFTSAAFGINWINFLTKMSARKFI